MSATTLQRPAINQAGIALLVGIAVLLLVFREEGQAAVQVWSQSTAYGHCFFVIPIALFLAWERRAVAMATPIVPIPYLALLAIPVAVVWLAAERLGIMEGQQIMAMVMMELMFLCVLGWRMFRSMAVPLLYLGFLVPFGAFLTPALQHFTAWFTTTGLDVIGVPYFSDGNLIEIPEGNFLVAEACAGLRFLIASIAFGVLYACMIYRTWFKRAVFIAASVVIPIVANGFRALGIVWLGHAMGSAEAVEVDHVLYGWIFFSIVIVLLILVGLPFREDAGPFPVPKFGGAFPSPASRTLWGTLALLLGLAAVAPCMALALDERGVAMPREIAAPATPSGCVADPAHNAGLSGRRDFAYLCDRGQLQLRVAVFAERINPAAINQALRAQTGELAAEDVTVTTLHRDAAADWRIISTTGPDRLVATALWIDARPASGGLAQRVALALHSVRGAKAAPVLVTITETLAAERLSSAQLHDISASMQSLVDANPGLPAQMIELGTSLVAPPGATP